FIGLASLAETRTPLRRNPVAIAGAVVVCAISLPLLRGLNVVTKPISLMDSRSAFAFAARHLEEGDVVLTDQAADPSYPYYAPKNHLPRVATFSLTKRAAQCAADGSLLRKIRYNHRRAWVILTDHAGREPKDRTTQSFSGFRELFGPQGTTFRGNGDAAAAVFEFGPRPAPSAPSASSAYCLFVHAARSYRS